MSLFPSSLMLSFDVLWSSIWHHPFIPPFHPSPSPSLLPPSLPPSFPPPSFPPTQTHHHTGVGPYEEHIILPCTQTIIPKCHAIPHRDLTIPDRECDGLSVPCCQQRSCCIVVSPTSLSLASWKEHVILDQSHGVYVSTTSEHNNHFVMSTCVFEHGGVYASIVCVCVCACVCVCVCVCV